MHMRRTMLFQAIASALAFSSPPGGEKGCFNYYTGSCTGCGEPDKCGVGHNGEQGYAMPTYYTGDGGYCDHCIPAQEGCWDGSFAGGPEHCTCVTEAECVADSPAYVPCSACGANGDPELKTLPEASPFCYNMANDGNPPLHDCKCGMTEDECKVKDGYVWTTTCHPYCVNPHGGAGPEGCYHLTEHKCECGTTKAECEAKPGYGTTESEWFWTPGCGSCAGAMKGEVRSFMLHGYDAHVTAN